MSIVTFTQDEVKSLRSRVYSRNHPIYTVYLAGPITGMSYGTSTDWRTYCDEYFPDWMHALSPMRGKRYLAHETEIAASYENSVLSCADGIMARDSNDVKRADLVIANFLGATRISIGTIIECAWAWQHGKPVVMCIEPDGTNIHEHPMLSKCAGFRCYTLDEAILVAERVLSVGI